MEKREFGLSYHIMMLPCIILLIIFSVVPMIGIVIAFQEFNPVKGIFASKWIGLENFKYMLMQPECGKIFFNTVFISVIKIIGSTLASLTFALLLNEIRNVFYKRFVQTVVYLPHFISWVMLSLIFFDLFSINGIINKAISFFGGDAIMFFASNQWFPAIIIVTDIWKGFGFGAIVYIAALTAISAELYESADIDGATRMQKLRNITLPGITTTIVLLTTLSLGSILNANFDQIFNMYNPLVYPSTDIIDTYVYRIGLRNNQYGLATAVGLLKSVVSFLLIITSQKLASRFANYRIF